MASTWSGWAPNHVPQAQRVWALNEQRQAATDLVGDLQQITSGMSGMVVLPSGNEVQWNVLLVIDRRDFETSHYLKVPLTQPGRLFFFCLSHSRVVRCDFIES
ncbi:hypothetical protein ABH909_003349 [Pseudomonas sp. BS3782 TE3695]